MTRALAGTAPFWQPGTRHGYHGLTFGFLVGELVRRVSGQSLDAFFEAQVAKPLGLEFWLGLPQSQEHRVAPTIPADLNAPGARIPGMLVTASGDPASAPALMLFNNGGYLVPGESDTRAAHAAVMGAVGGITTARSLAEMYRPLALDGEYDGFRLIDQDHIPVMSAVAAASSVDAVIGTPTRFALGFVKAVDNSHLSGADGEGVPLSEEAFGHIGFGGSIGFADPGARLSFAYVMNRQGSGLGVNERGRALIGAAYRALGYRRAGGNWHG
jgi:CubicO group peptidase (beta-lactamase class C family)